LKNKSITILTQYFYPEIGAPQTRLLETALGLKSLGWEVNVITAFPNYPTGKIHEKYKFKVCQKEKVEGIDVIRFWMFPSNNKKTIPRVVSMLSFSIMALFAIFRIMRTKPQFIYTESPPLTLGITGLFLAKVCKAKHIFNVSDIWPLSAFELNYINQHNWVYRLAEKFEKKIYKSSTAFTGQSEEIVSYLKSFDLKNVALYRNGVDFSKYLKSQPKEISCKRKIVYAGLLGVAQGVAGICKNVDFVKANVDFHIYGDGPEKKEIETILCSKKNSNIYYHGIVSNDEIPMIFKKHDFTLIPLVKNIFGAVPSKIFEAMASGTPILFSGTGEGAKLIENYNVGRVCAPNDFEAIENLLIEMSRLQESDIECMHANGVNAAQKHFDRKIQINHLSEFIQSL
jgi:glycosyltransferase involved in cell wall biosynthesis